MVPAPRHFTKPRKKNTFQCLCKSNGTNTQNVKSCPVEHKQSQAKDEYREKFQVNMPKVSTQKQFVFSPEYQLL